MADTRLDKRLKLSGALPAENTDNGIDHLAGVLVDDPEGQMVLCIAVLDVKAVTYDVPTGTHVPMLRIQRVEGVHFVHACVTL